MAQEFDSPIFSVLIPTYNRANLLPRAIQSVLHQTYTNFEILVVDDASTDNTSTIVKQFKDERITYTCRDVNQGNAAAKNSGISQARGQYIAFLDDDDEYLPNFLSSMQAALSIASHDVGFLWCGVQNIIDTPTGEIPTDIDLWQPQYKSREHAYLSFLHWRSISAHNGLTIRKSCFNTVGMFDESLRKAVDTDLLIRLVRHYDFTVVPDVLVKHHSHSGPRVRKNAQWGADAYAQIIKKHEDTLRKHPDLWTELHYKAGWQYYHAGDRSNGRKFIQQALQKKRFDLKCWTALFLFEGLGIKGSLLHQKISTWKHMRKNQSAI